MMIAWQQVKELLKRFSELQAGIEPTTSVTHALAIELQEPRTVGSVGWASGCDAGGRDSGRTNIQGLKITE